MPRGDVRVVLGPAALYVAAGVALIAPLLLGGAHAVVAVPLSSLAVFALALHVTDRWLGRGRLSVSRVVLPIVVGVIWTSLALVPLPRAIRHLLSPVATDRMEFVTSALSPAGQAWVLPVLSQDPPATALALVRLIGALAIFIVIADRARNKSNRRTLFRMVLAAAGLTLVVTIGHTIVGANEIYGLSFTAKRGLISVAPLVNPNHLARVFGVFAILLLARGLDVRNRQERLVYLGTAAACAAMAFATGSHGGALAMTLTVGGMFTLWRMDVGDDQEELAPRSRWRVALLLGAPAALIGITLVVFKDLISRAIGDSGPSLAASSKFGLYPLALDVLGDNLWVGAGNNAFQAAVGSSLEVDSLWSHSSVSHPENVVLQTLVDHGILVGGGLLVLCALIGASFLAPMLRRRAPPLVFGAVFFLVLGDLVDFSLEVAFGLWLCVLSMAMATGHTQRRTGSAFRLRPAAMFGLAATSALVLAGASWLAVVDERWTTDRALAAGRMSLERAIARHPHDGHYAYKMATAARRAKRAKESLVWSTRAVLLWPGHAGGHLEAARALAAVGALDQSLLEYRLAAERGRPMLLEMMSRTKNLEKRLASLPPGAISLHEQLCGDIRYRERDLLAAEACYQALSERPKAPPAARLRVVEMALLRKDAETARAQLTRFAKTPTAATATLWATLIELEQGLEAALAQSGTWFAGSGVPSELLVWRLAAAMRHGDYSLAASLIRALETRPLAARERLKLHQQSATLLERTGQPAAALRAWRQVSRRHPKNLGALLKLVQLEMSLGLRVEARLSLERARRLSPDHPRVLKLDAALSAP